MRKTIGLFALVFAILSLSGSLFKNTYGPLEDTPGINEVIKKKTMDFKEYVSSGFKGERETKFNKNNNHKVSRDELLRYFILVTGYLGIIFSVFSFINKEDPRVYNSAVVISTGSMLFHQLVIAIVALLLFLYLKFVTSD